MNALRKAIPSRHDPQNPINKDSGLTDRNMLMVSKFAVEIDKISVGYFHKVSGLAITTEVEEIKEGGENRFTHMLPKHTSLGKVTLERGVVQRNLLWKWYAEMFEDGKLQPRNVHIHAYENIHGDNIVNLGLHMRQSQSLIKWTLVDALPIKWEGPLFDANKGDNARAIEKLTFVFARLKRDTGFSLIELGDSEDDL